MRLAYFGSPEFAVASLAQLVSSAHEVVAVITQPDRPRGRGQKMTPTPVGQYAAGIGLPVLRPERLRDDEFLATFDALGADLAVVAAYGKILPARLLERPRLGFINVHASLLPRWRGAAPVHRAVIAGDEESGITIMRVVPELDAGPMLDRVVVPIGPNETSAELEPRLAAVGAELLVRVIDRLAVGPVPETAQDESLVTYAARITKAEGRVDWLRPAIEVHNHIRGLQPWPLVSAFVRGRRIALTRTEVVAAAGHVAPPGTVIAVEPGALVVASQPGAVRVREVQPEGRPPMAVRDFLNGWRVAAGDRLDPAPSQ